MTQRVDEVRRRIKMHRGETFRQIKGGEFTYCGEGQRLSLSQTNHHVPRAHVEERWRWCRWRTPSRCSTSERRRTSSRSSWMSGSGAAIGRRSASRANRLALRWITWHTNTIRHDPTNPSTKLISNGSGELQMLNSIASSIETGIWLTGATAHASWRWHKAALSTICGASEAFGT